MPQTKKIKKPEKKKKIKKVKATVKKEKATGKKALIKKERVVKKKTGVGKEAETKKDKLIAKTPLPAQLPKGEARPSQYIEAIGRRKTAVARVRLWTRGERCFLVNEKPYKEYFTTPKLQQIALVSFQKMKCLDKFRISARVKGGGIHAQAEAIRHGGARALVKFNPDFKKRLKKAGFLIRDPRMRERKKFGLRRARRAPQWKKR